MGQRLQAGTRAAVISIAFLALTGCGRLSNQPAAGVVPWVDRPAVLATASPSPPPYSTVAPPCQASHLRASRGLDGASGGNHIQGFILKNIGLSACQLAGQPGVTALNRANQRISLSAKAGTQAGPLYPADIPAGASGYLYFSTASACGSTAAEQSASTLYRAIQLELPGGSTLPTGLELSVGSCGLWMDNLGLPAPPVPAATPKPGSAGVLTARLELPTSARAGETLHYVVGLMNPSTTAIKLSPCPSYTQTLGYPMSVNATYRLNCDQVTTIAPGVEVRYAMEMHVPSNATLGLTKFSWAIEGNDGPDVGVTITVR